MDNKSNHFQRLSLVSMIVAIMFLVGCGAGDQEGGASSSSSSSGSSFIPPIEEIPAEPELVMAVNAGGPAANLGGVQYHADNHFTGGNTYATTSVITGTTQGALFQTERYGDFSYSFPVSNGSYSVVLHFAEIFNNAPEKRKFNVVIEGQRLIVGFDIFQVVGFLSAHSRELKNISVNDGNLNINFETVLDNPKISGIAVYRTRAVMSHADKGKVIFDKQCSVCHAATEKNLGTQADGSGHNFESLSVATENMPPAAFVATFGACDAECAYYTAKYIASVNPFYGLPKPGPLPQVPTAQVDSIPPVMSRLNKVEYNNTIRDLFGITSKPADSFPEDQSGIFSNDNAALSTSSLHVERFNNAALSIATEAVNAAATGNRAAIGCDLTNASCAQLVIDQLGLKVWRRPLTTEEKSSLKSLYDKVQAATNDRKTSMTAILHAMLLSPNFHFRPEFDQNLMSNQAKPLSAYELASRMSYFLWSSTPDSALLAKAADGSLLTDATLRAEVTRMLADARADSLLDNFAWTWLGFADQHEHQVDTNQFPQYSDTIAKALLSETQTFLRHILKEGRPISEILVANYTFLNETLANYYGVTGVSGNQMRRYDWPEGSQRKGLLGHGSALTAHSHPNKTSPVKRGTWVMDRFMCDRPPEPPGNVISLFPKLPEGLNPRAESELHKDASEVCSSCHAYVDPIGYAMENFSPIGQWREVYPNGDIVDPSSILPTGEQFFSLVELADILGSKTQVTLCSISYAMTYATGRRFTTLTGAGQSPDYPAVYKVYSDTLDSAHSIKDVFTEIVLSPAFRMRRGADSQ